MNECDDSLILSLSAGGKESVAFQTGAIVALFDLGLLHRVRLWSGAGFGCVTLRLLLGALHETRRARGACTSTTTEYLHDADFWKSVRLRTRAHNQKPDQPRPRWVIQFVHASRCFAQQNLESSMLRVRLSYPSRWFSSKGSFVLPKVFQMIGPSPLTTHTYDAVVNSWRTDMQPPVTGLDGESVHSPKPTRIEDPVSEQEVDQNGVIPVVLFSAVYHSTRYSHKDIRELAMLQQGKQIHEVVQREIAVVLTNDQQAPGYTQGCEAHFISMLPKSKWSSVLSSVCCRRTDDANGFCFQERYTWNADHLDPLGLRGADVYFTRWRLASKQRMHISNQRGRVLLIDGFTNTKAFHRSPAALQEAVEASVELLTHISRGAEFPRAFGDRVVQASRCLSDKKNLLASSAMFADADSGWRALSSDEFDAHCNWGYHCCLSHHSTAFDKGGQNQLIKDNAVLVCAI
jgi:hypothetical protein